VDIGSVNERKFVFSAGVGLDASVVERVDAHPHLKARYGEWYYTVTGVTTFTRRYLLRPPRFEARIGDETIAGVTAIIQNSTPYTYFGDRPVQMAEGATLTSGDLAGVVLDRARPTDVPTIIGRALSRNLKVSRHRHVHSFSGVQGLSIRSVDERPLPLQVDGDYLGEVAEAVFGVTPRGIAVVS
jgi:diacylglycerol kinase family enzyme